MDLILKEHILPTDTKEVVKLAEELAKVNDRAGGKINTPARFYDYGTKQELMKEYNGGFIVEPNTVFLRFRSQYAMEEARRQSK